MLVLDSHNNPMIIDNIYGPNVVDYIWVLDLQLLDFTLAPLNMIEELICSSVQISVNGFEFVVPAEWNILIYDQDTSQLDVVPFSETAGKQFTAMVAGPDHHMPEPHVISMTNYFIEYKNVSPVLNKHQMLCHPIGDNKWIVIGSADGFNKYLKDTIAGQLF